MEVAWLISLLNHHLIVIYRCTSVVFHDGKKSTNCVIKIAKTSQLKRYIYNISINYTVNSSFVSL